MYRFKNLQRAASFALRCRGATLVFDGPEDDYVVALGAEARQLEADGHEPYTLRETAKAVGEERA